VSNSLIKLCWPATSCFLKVSALFLARYRFAPLAAHALASENSYSFVDLGYLLVAGSYLVLVPKAAKDARVPNWQRLILKYAHSLVWLLLELTSLPAPSKGQLAWVEALEALSTYLIFLSTVIWTRSKRNQN
jgi:hypothetical protein